MKKIRTILALFIVLGFISTLVGGVGYVSAQGATIERQVATQSDDCQWTTNGNFYTNNGNTILGYWTYSWAGGMGGGWRFTNITIPRGVLITNAKILFRSHSISPGSGSNVDLKIRGEDSDNATAPSSWTDYNNRPRTSAYVDWYDVATWAAATWYYTPDISAVVQEIVDRDGWVSGNSLVIFVNDDGSSSNHYRSASAYTDGATRAAKISITYEILNQAPICSLVASPDSGTAPLTVSLNGSGSSDPDGTIAKYEWDWTADGTYDYSESPGDGIATNIYNTAGNYTARLRVTDNGGATSTCTDTISVSAPPAYTPEKTMCAKSSGSGGGVVSAQSITSPSTTAAISARSWVVTGYDGVYFPTYLELQTMHDYTNVTPIATNPLTTDLSEITSSGIYKIERDFTLASTPCTLPGSPAAVVFVNGDLDITTNFRTTAIDLGDDPLGYRNACNSSLAFIVKGDITIAAGVNNIYGIFYAGGDVGMSTETSPNPLYIFGSLLAHDFNLNRNLGADNTAYPAEQIIFMPKYFITLKDVLGRPQISWREGN